MRQETGAHFQLEQWYWDSYLFSKRVRHCHVLKHWIPYASRGVKVMWFPMSRLGGVLRLSLGSPQGIQTSLHLVRWKTSLNLSHCREIRPSFASGPLVVHSNWDRKHRVPLTYLLLNENSTWGACWKFAHLFSQRQGISSHLGMIWSSWSITRVCCTEISIHIDLRQVSQGNSVVS